MEQAKPAHRFPGPGTLVRLALAVLLGSLVPAFLAGETRTATTSVGISVTRHAGLLLPEAGFVRSSISATALRSEGPAPIGNGEPRVTIVQATDPASVASGRPPRVAVIVFEP